MKRNSSHFFVILILILVVTLPYVLAWMAGGADFRFSGFLLNPQDGASYLAKMRIGYEGAWLFQLPFTAQTGQEYFLFPFYILLGHLSRLLGVPLAVGFHISRMIGVGFLIWEGARWLEWILGDQLNLWKGRVWIIFFLGGGLGWLALASEQIPMDFWVAEAFPFLSVFSSPHFSLGLALLLWLIRSSVQPNLVWWKQIMVVLGGFCLANLHPFAVVLLGTILGGLLIWESVIQKRFAWRTGFWSVAVGAGVLIYQYWVINHDPLLALWNSQNQTPSPSIWIIMISFSPAILFAVPGTIALLRQKKDTASRVLILWVIGGLVLSFMPFNLQRRFLTGYAAAVVPMAVWGWDWLRQRNIKTARTLSLLTVFLVIPTNLLLIFGLMQQANSHNSLMYYSRTEEKAYQWLSTNSEKNELVIASPESGLFIPGMTGLRVFYGHPFETVNAEQEKMSLEAYFRGETDLEEYRSRGADYLFLGPREKQYMGNLDVQNYIPVYQQDDITIYRIPHQ